MSRNSRIAVTVLGGWFGLHKYLDKKIGMDILYTFTCGLFCIGWFYDIYKAFSLKKDIFTESSIYHILSSEDCFEFNDRRNEMWSASEKYFSGVEQIESMWSVMYNLGITSGTEADSFVEKCHANLLDLQNMLEVNRKYGYDDTIPPHVPAYVRLAMLYERQQDYEKAIDVCVEAIHVGAVNDGNKGKMYGRLARLIKKSGITVDDEVFHLAQK